VLGTLNVFAEILDVATEAFGCLATRGNESHEPHGNEEKQELFH
jgi:hypothetical protein